MKKARVVTAVNFSEGLGMPTLTLADQDGKSETFHFLPSQFSGFAQAFRDAGERALPADLTAVAPIPKAAASTSAQTAAVAAKWSQSQSAAFALYTNPVENVSFLCLRQASGDEAVVPLDAETIEKLITHLRAAQDAIRPAAAGRH